MIGQGTKRERLGRDAMRNFNACSLCLGKANLFFEFILLFMYLIFLLPFLQLELLNQEFVQKDIFFVKNVF